MLLAIAAGCASAQPAEEEQLREREVESAPPSPAGVATAIPAAALPVAPARFAPSHVEIGGGADAAIPGARIADAEACGTCHADALAQWRTSAHAFASFNNPIYRVSVDGFRRDSGNEKSRFCAGCHDIALLVDGAMDREVRPGDHRASAGITCQTCHGVERVKADGNASYTLTASPIPLPEEGDPASLEQHLARVKQEPLRSGEICASCHKTFLSAKTGHGHHLPGADDVSPWRRSAYAGSHLERIDEPIAEQDCRSCHMAREDAARGDVSAENGTIASHRFLGGHSWLAAMRGDGDQQRRVEAMLRGAASIDVAAVIHEQGRALPADGAPVIPGRRMIFDVVVKNLRVGHRFPGGTLDAHDTWIELAVHDAAGHLVAEAGAQHEQSGADPTAHQLKAIQAGEDGQPLLAREAARFRAVIYNHTILPRDAAVIEYGLDVPAAMPPGPLKVTARLRHRSRALPMQRAACADFRSPRGKDFGRDGKNNQRLLDPCAPQPVIAVAESVVWIGPGWEEHAARASALPPAAGALPASPRRAAWSRLYDHALGLQHAVQERLDEGRPSLERALAELERVGGSDREQAMVMALMGRLAARQGRTAEAFEWIERAETKGGAHPALDALRGEALSLVWRWRDAVAPLRRAASAAPRDDLAWSRLAVALGSFGDDRGALDAAIQGLALQPRDPDLLRVQALSLRGLGAPADQTAAAEEAHLLCRITDATPKIRSLCSKNVPGCALERVPVHVHEMRLAPRG